MSSLCDTHFHMDQICFERLLGDENNFQPAEGLTYLEIYGAREVRI
jgi:hypothetical protein